MSFVGQRGKGSAAGGAAGGATAVAGGRDGHAGRAPGSDDPTRIRVLVAKVGLDGHDRGVKIVARTLRDAGMEVIYTGLHRTPAEVVTAAVQEDVDVLGISLLSGAHMTIFPEVIRLLGEAGAADDISLIGGGVMPDEDVDQLTSMGVAAILGQDCPPERIVTTVREVVASRRRAGAGREGR